MTQPIGAVLSTGAGTRYVEIASHREYIGSMVDACWRCGSRSIVAETYGTGLEVRCLLCCRDQTLDTPTWKNVVMYVAAKLKGKSSYFG
jgi:hypothetical protein